MSDAAPDPETKIARLEREVWHHRWIVIVAVLAALALAGVAAYDHTIGYTRPATLG